MFVSSLTSYPMFGLPIMFSRLPLTSEHIKLVDLFQIYLLVLLYES